MNADKFAARFIVLLSLLVLFALVMGWLDGAAR